MAGREPRHLHRLPQIVNTTALEDRIDLQQREIQSLLVDNQRLAATHVALKQELSATQSGLRNIKAVAVQVKSERNAEVREVYDRSLKLDEELRALDAMSAELTQVRDDIAAMAASRSDLVTDLRTLEAEIELARSPKQAEVIRADMETFKHEIHKGRAAIENEMKTRASNLEYRKAMENYMAALALEIEKLHGELANAEKIARAAKAAAASGTNAGSGYPKSYGDFDPEMLYGTYPEAYTIHQGQAGADLGHYGSSRIAHVAYDIQETHDER